MGRIREGLYVMALRALRDPIRAEEAAQESMSRLLEALGEDRLDDPARLTAFARGIARHVIVDLQRSRNASSRSELQPDEMAADSRDTNPLSRLIDRERRERLLAAISRLSERDRSVLRLSFYEGLTSVEIARRCGEPPSRVRKRKSRALQRLRRAFTAGNHGPGVNRPSLQPEGEEGRTGVDRRRVSE